MSVSSSVTDIVLHYPFASQLVSAVHPPRLELATARNLDTVSPYYFEGHLYKPRTAAAILMLLPKLSLTRFHMPQNMLAQVMALADPVVTCSRDIIRLEAFSACGSTYARMDVDANACDGAFLGKGTTNVDFQPALRDALSAVSAEGDLGLSVGRNEVKLSVDRADFLERKVQLPARWVRGFAEVSAYQARMTLVHDVSKVAAARFLAALPGSDNDKAQYYLVLRRGEFSLTQHNQDGAVKVAGLTRLKALRSLAPLIDRLRIFTNKPGSAASWLIDAGPYRLEFVISAATYRGFSGEGQLLTDLVTAESDPFIPAVRAALNWQSRIETAQLASHCGTTSEVVNSCLGKLASQGLVGFDCASSAYFHRELPFKPARSVTLNPRLRGARDIVDGDVIEIVDVDSHFAEARVAGSGVTHIVRQTATGSTCTCVWYAKHQEERGPCKHILSLQILLEKMDADGS